MFYMKKSNIILRDYGDFCYITDNRNFGYRKDNIIGDKILSESGAVFMSFLGNKIQSFDFLLKEISQKFSNVKIEIIEKDLKEFLLNLEEDRFIVSGETIQECKEKDLFFISQKDKKNGLSINSISSPLEFLDTYSNGKPQLKSVHIEITSKCNEKCLHCYIPEDNKIEHIDPDLFFKILNQSYDMKVLHLTISGGEPMLHPKFYDFLKKCKEYNFSVNILTNLTLLNQNILDEIKTNPLISLQVSLYSIDENIHDKITQIKGSHQKTMDGIFKLIKSNIPLQISCPIMKLNKKEFLKVKKWANQYNISSNSDYTILARYDHTTENLNNRLSINEVKKIMNKTSDTVYIEQLKKQAEEKKQDSINDNICSVCTTSLCITEQGKTYPCAGWQDCDLGNLNNDNLQEIWMGSKKIKSLRNIKKKDFKECLTCSDKEYCTMCMVRNANEDSKGNHFAINNYFCQIAKLNKQIVNKFK